MYERDTIAAIATPPGQGGVAIIRISGSEAESIARRVFLLRHPVVALQSHHLYLGSIINSQNGQFLDEGLLTIMRAPRSYTGEDVAEIHCHGGGFVARAILALVLQQGARLAHPGEFTKRAFLNGRLDLAQAEAVLDLIQAKSEQGLHLAWEQLSGHLSETSNTLREQLLRLTAYVEAFLDFPEEDIPEKTHNEIEQEILVLIDEVSTLASTFTQGKVYRDGVRTAIVGKPNVGKSSLLNLLIGTERAIVTAVPGTTRDILEETVVVGGIPLVLWDTAGLRQTSDEVERIGVERARLGVQEADLVLAVFDSSRPFDQEDEGVLATIFRKPCIPIINKTDLPTVFSFPALDESSTVQAPVLLSAKTGQGKTELEARIQEVVLGTTQQQEQLSSVLVSKVRHRDALIKTKHHLNNVLLGLQSDLPFELIAVDLRAALDHIGEITGHVTSEEILDQIFREFCIGK
ncbi:MAG: tRNA uridine-5-carboxymethylaminomethyl(34) synthesis GTPase MnmE [Candidatus Caldarchaeum sp.]